MAISEILSPKMDVDGFRPENLPKVAKLAAYARAETHKSLFQLFNTAIPFGVMWALMYKSLALPYWATLLLAIPTGGLLVRLFIMQHDAGHGSFFASKKANDLVGFIIGVLTITPYEYWQKTHAIHHATSGNLDKRGYGDIDTLTVREYQSLSPREQFKYRAYRHPFTMFVVGPLFQFMVKHRWPWNVPFTWKREWRSVHLTNLALVIVTALAAATIGLKSFFLVQLPITVVSCAAGAWLFYVQHQYEDTYWERDDRWDYFDASTRGSSMYVLPKVLQWFTGNIGLHHIHHYNSRIPNYKLQACFDENPEFQKVTQLNLWTGLKSIHLALWDESRQKLVSFSDLKTAS